ncbi:MAG: TylF/MycF/NovP-related O-methyltransferase [Candidatus Dormibacteria bacterium]
MLNEFLALFTRRPAAGGQPAGAAAPGPAATPADARIIEAVRPFSMTGDARVQALIDAVRYTVARGLDGALVECGVWRGGSIMAMILTLQEMGIADRDIYLYDTFEGMTQPTERDISAYDAPASQTWGEAEAGRQQAWSYLFSAEHTGEAAVRQRVLATGYPAERLHFVAGRVEDTIPADAPGRIALLRLDTDWYESTRHELVHLYPRLSTGGVLIVDDYGHWDGCRQAVDEYFAAHGPVLLGRVDYAARMAVKP